MINHVKSTGERGLKLIKEFEGQKLEKYQDAAGRWTIGFGHLIQATEQFSARISLREATELLEHDLVKAEEGVYNNVKVALTQNQFDALVSFVFNIGIGNFKNSTLLRILNQKKYNESAKQLLRWNKVGKRDVPGLLRRRVAEYKLFLSNK